MRWKMRRFRRCARAYSRSKRKPPACSGASTLQQVPPTTSIFSAALKELDAAMPWYATLSFSSPPPSSGSRCSSFTTCSSSHSIFVPLGLFAGKLLVLLVTLTRRLRSIRRPCVPARLVDRADGCLQEGFLGVQNVGPPDLGHDLSSGPGHSGAANIIECEIADFHRVKDAIKPESTLTDLAGVWPLVLYRGPSIPQSDAAQTDSCST